jgi:hypothetical protein
MNNCNEYAPMDEVVPMKRQLPPGYNQITECMQHSSVWVNNFMLLGGEGVVRVTFSESTSDVPPVARMSVTMPISLFRKMIVDFGPKFLDKINVVEQMGVLK